MRIRTVKPELFLHDDLYDLEEETGLPVRLAFIGLFCASDREGRFKWKPRRLKASIMPHDDIDFSRVLDALATRGFLVKYASGTEEFGHIPSFLDHQSINNRESASTLPAPTQPIEIKADLTRESRVDDACPTPLMQDQGEGKGREGKGREGKEIPPTPLSPEPELETLALEVVADAPPGGSKSLAMIRLELLFKRKPSTKWSEKEIKAFKKIDLDLEELDLVCRYYAATIIESGTVKDIRRRDLQTLLNNWTGEVDRARAYLDGKPRFAGLQEDKEIPF